MRWRRGPARARPGGRRAAATDRREQATGGRRTAPMVPRRARVPARRNVLPAASSGVLARRSPLVACGGGGSAASDEEAERAPAPDLRQPEGGAQRPAGPEDGPRRQAACQGVEGPVAMHLTGPVRQRRQEGRPPKFDFDAGPAHRRRALKAGAVSDGREGLPAPRRAAPTRSPDAVSEQPRRRGGQGRGQAADAQRPGPRPAPLAERRPRRGRGAPSAASRTVHITRRGRRQAASSSDLDKLLAARGRRGPAPARSAPDALLGQHARRARASPSDRADVDIWTGEARQDAAPRWPSSLDCSSARRAGRRAARMRFDLSVADLNQQQAIGPPADPRPLVRAGRGAAGLAAPAQAQSGGGRAVAARTARRPTPQAGRARLRPRRLEHDAASEPSLGRAALRALLGKCDRLLTQLAVPILPRRCPLRRFLKAFGWSVPAAVHPDRDRARARARRSRCIFFPPRRWASSRPPRSWAARRRSSPRARARASAAC